MPDTSEPMDLQMRSTSPLIKEIIDVLAKRSGDFTTEKDARQMVCDVAMVLVRSADASGLDRDQIGTLIGYAYEVFDTVLEREGNAMANDAIGPAKGHA